MISPCIVDSTFGEPLMPCPENAECNADIREYAANGYNQRDLEPVGLSRDGHVIWGPYK